MSSGRNSIGAAGLLLAYSCMAFPDAIGVVAALANAMGVSRRQAEVLFRRLAGKTIHDEITDVKIERAEHLLRHPGQGVSAIVLCIGLSSAVLVKGHS